MMKRKRTFSVQALIAVVICSLVLSGCGAPKEEIIAKYTPDLTTEAGIMEYLVGDWHYFNEYSSQVLCDMTIDEDLKVHLLFHDIYGGENRGEYTGQIKLDRAYTGSDEAQDLIVIELEGTEEPGGDFFFLHRTLFDGQFAMSWFYAGNGNCVFDVLGPKIEGYAQAPDEIVFQKETTEKTQLTPIKNGDFHAVFWGVGEDWESIWIDDVTWTPTQEDDFATPYPWRMTYYENDVKESVLYTIAPEMIVEILGDDLFPGTVYLVETNENGEITSCTYGEYEEYTEAYLEDYADPETEAAVFNVIYSDVKEIEEYMNQGMAAMVTNETVLLDNGMCSIMVLGTNSEDQFVRELYYAINTETHKAYRYDVLTDEWSIIK